MHISMYNASVPVFIRYLGNLKNILEIAVAHAEAKKIEPSVLINSRLAPNMYPLSRQIQLVSDMAKSCPSRLAGLEVPKFEDTETTFEELFARIDKTVAHLKTFKPEQVDGTEDKIITVPTGGTSIEIAGLPYVTQFIIPNFIFHVTTAYAILRHCGVELTKPDFLGTV